MVDNEIELQVGTGAGRGEYVVRVVRSASGGEPQGPLNLDVEGLVSRRPQVEATVLASSARGRSGLASAAERPLRQVGTELFEALFAGSVGGAYRASLAVARDRGKRLRVVLRLDAPELSVLPWEAMWDPELEAYLCRREPLVRHVPAPFSPEPLTIDSPLRILGLVASPRGLPGLDVEAERRHLDDALAGSVEDGRVVLEWLSEASWGNLHERLLTSQWHVLHFIGHGDYDSVLDQGRLALVGEGGRADWVEASRLADLLDEAEPTPRLVVLNSCSSGAGGTEDLFSGLAAALVRSGIGAVTAMQFSVSDAAAVTFPRGFYTALAAGRGVDEAVRSGRIEILGTPNSLEWVTPVLYLRGNATRLFDVTTPPSPATPEVERAPAAPEEAKSGLDLPARFDERPLTEAPEGPVETPHQRLPELPLAMSGRVIPTRARLDLPPALAPGGKARHRRRWAWLLVAVVAVGGVVFGLSQRGGDGPSSRVSVLNVYNVLAERGLQNLRDQGFASVRLIPVCSNSVSAGRIRQVILDNGAALGRETEVVGERGVSSSPLPLSTKLLVKVSSGPC